MTNNNNKDQKKYPITEAIELAKSLDKAKFDSTIELHINLGINPKKDDEIVRTSTVLPNGSGKTVKVAVFSSSSVKNADLELSDDDLAKIESGKIRAGTDFDVLVAEPKMMSKLGKVARILGPQGAMPSPKAGTVTDNVSQAVDEIKKGKVVIKNEQLAPLIHTILGKKSFSTDKLVENYKAVISAVRSAKGPKVNAEKYIQEAFVCGSMGKSVKVDLTA